MPQAIYAKAQEDYNITVAFSDGKIVSYDIKPMFSVVPAFRVLKTNPNLFQRVTVDNKGAVISWNENLNLDAQNIWENGVLVEHNKKPKIKHLIAYSMQLARMNLGLTQKELSEKTGICQADISKLERGLGNPSLSTLERLADGLGMNLYIDLRPVEEEKEMQEEGYDLENQNSFDEFKHRTLEERAAEYGGNLNLDGEYDWGEPVGREVW